MTVMYSFCFYFSVRLGCIIVGLTSIAQSVAALVACGIGMDDLPRTSTHIEHWLQTNDLLVTKIFFVAMRDDPESYLTAFIAVFTVYLCSCLLLILGAFRCNIFLMYPFMALDLIKLIILSIILIIVMLIVKKNTLSLALVIGGSVSGGFALLFLWYEWFCTVALCQIIREVKRLDKSRKVGQNSGRKNKAVGFDNKVALVGDYYYEQRYTSMPNPTM